MQVNNVGQSSDVIDKLMSATREKEQVDAQIKVSQAREALNKSLMRTAKDQNDGSVDTYA
jgi:hypothetical protein